MVVRTSHQTIEQRVKRIMSKSEIASVALVFNGHGVAANAKPAGFHPLVAARRQEAFAAAGKTLSMAEATEITNSSMGAVGRGYGSDINQALASLEHDLNRAAG